MKLIPTDLDPVVLIEPGVHTDLRGHFFESWNARRYAGSGLAHTYVQDNVSYSRQGVLRGLHFQNPSAQAKLVTVLKGKVFDVAVDLRVDSSTFRKWTAAQLSAANGRQIYIPEGFAHGFVVLGDDALVHYKCTDYYDPDAEASIRWDDPELGIEWPIENPVLSERDAAAPLLAELDGGRLFRGEFIRPS